MKPSELTHGIYAVTHPGYPPDFAATRFNLSVVVCKFVIVKGVAAFEKDGKPPKRGKHLQLTDSVCGWMEELRLEP